MNETAKKEWLHSWYNVASTFSHVHSWIAMLCMTGQEKTGWVWGGGYLLTVAAHLILQSTMSNKLVSVLVWQPITCFLNNGALSPNPDSAAHMSLFRGKYWSSDFWSECILPQWRHIRDSKKPKLQDIAVTQPTIIYVCKIFKRSMPEAWSHRFPRDWNKRSQVQVLSGKISKNSS